MTEFEFDLADRIAKIKAVNEQYDLERDSFISFSGGKDSTVLSKLIDIALPDNRIPRVFFNTGIEYRFIVDFVKELASEDDRFVIQSSAVPIISMLEEKGYPFKSKEFSQKYAVYQHSGKTKTVTDYLGETGNKAKTFQCPDKLKVMFTENLPFKVSDKCCFELKKNISENWSKEHGRSVVMTGMRKAEGGNRKSVQGCTVFDKGKLHKFHPLFPVNEGFIDGMIDKYQIKLCSLYYPPYNFERTGCKGCPYNMKLKSQLEQMKSLLPQEYKQCMLIWGKVYSEYERLNYRLVH